MEDLVLGDLSNLRINNFNLSCRVVSVLMTPSAERDLNNLVGDNDNVDCFGRLLRCFEEDDLDLEAAASDISQYMGIVSMPAAANPIL